MLLSNGKVQQWPRHYVKLLKDCSAINLSCPSESVLDAETQLLARGIQSGVLKIIVTRGMSQRGYAPTLASPATRILSVSPLPEFPPTFSELGVRVHLCKLRLGYQPRLAGVKHLNRLDNVLAASEWDDPDVVEGVLMDESGNVIEGVRSNIFMVKAGKLFTPDLSRCGVSGVQRERVVDWATQANISCTSMEITLGELLEADEIFLVNSVIGVWPVREIATYRRECHPVTHAIQNYLRHESD